MDKPTGPTSHDVVGVVRRAVDTRRVGHAGTLDPFASGVLPVLIGRATRLARYLVGLPKQYTGTLRLGVQTDTDDATGVPTATADAGGASVTDAALAAAMGALTGTISQIPPVYSAKKIDGEPAYRRVRRGQEVALEPRSVQVDRFEVEERAGDDVHFTAHVSSGTYIRALARDLGTALGCGAHLTALRRVAVGPWTEGDATPLDAVVPGCPIRPPRAAVAHLPSWDVPLEAWDAVRHGRPTQAPDGDASATIALLAEGELLAVAEVRDGEAWPRVVLAG